MFLVLTTIQFSLTGCHIWSHAIFGLDDNHTTFCKDQDSHDRVHCDEYESVSVIQLPLSETDVGMDI